MSSSNSGGNDSISFTFKSLPQNISSLQSLPEASLDTPFKTAALVVAALCFYEKDPEETINMINFLKGPQPLSSHDKQFLKDRLSGKGYVPRSFFKGATPENNYTPGSPYSITILQDTYTFAEEGYAKVLIKSSGADSARPIKLRKKGAQWFLWENYLLSDIRKPARDDPWA